MAPRMRTTTPRCCGPTRLPQHVYAFLLVATMPCCTAWLWTGRADVVALVAASVAAPRLLSLASGGRCDTWLLTAALAYYWNVVMLVCFASPAFVLLCSYLRPRLVLPVAAAWLIWSRFLSRPDLADGRPWRSFSSTEWGYHAFRDYLSLRIHVDPKTASKPPTEPVVIAIHPHGVASDYRIMLDGMLYDALPGREVLTLAASVLFAIPLVRELSLWTRCIDASKPVASRALRKGHSLMVLPGGEREQIGTVKGVEEVFLAKRMGFVKLALTHGVPLVPCYAFGCVDLYDTYSFAARPREWLRRRFGVCIPLYTGRAGFLPNRVPLDVVIGAPMQMRPPALKGQPTDAEVQAAHADYVAALRQLFDGHKGEFGFGGRQLAVV